MTESELELIRSESPEWIEVFKKNWEVLKQQSPETSFAEAIKLTIKVRSLLGPIADSYFIQQNQPQKV
jgi:hypothetical protein